MRLSKINSAGKALPDLASRLSASKTAILLNKLGNFLVTPEHESYVVGGFVRDVLLGRDIVDIDIAVSADSLEIAQKVATAFTGKYVLLDKENRSGRVVLFNEKAGSNMGQLNIDISTCQGSIEQDLARRDFTIDAMAVDLRQIVAGGADVQLIDPFGGLNDLNQGIVRTVSETAFKADAVRLLRAVRLAAELDFNIDKKTESQIRDYRHLAASIAGERVREELLRILAISHHEPILPYLDKLGLITAIIPELEATKEVEQPREHYWDVFDHSIQTAITADFLLRQGDWEYANQEVLTAVPWSATLAQHFSRVISNGSTRRSLLKLAALLHDITKPQTKAFDEDGRMRFLGHAKDGAVIAGSILERLRFSVREIKLVEIMIRHHLRPVQMSHAALPSHRAIYRYFRDTEEAGIDILFLSLADHLAARGPRLDLTQWHEHAHVVEYVLDRRFQEETLIAPPRLLDGHDLINLYGLSPGPKIGELLEAVREAQAGGELATRQEALAYIGRLLSSSPALSC